jgi:hypothetical protein
MRADDAALVAWASAGDDPHCFVAQYGGAGHGGAVAAGRGGAGHQPPGRGTPMGELRVLQLEPEVGDPSEMGYAPVPAGSD